MNINMRANSQMPGYGSFELFLLFIMCFHVLAGGVPARQLSVAASSLVIAMLNYRRNPVCHKVDTTLAI